VKQALLAVIEYLVGFLALAIFASIAFSTANPSDERFLLAFKVGACVAALELGVLAYRSAPANRLILGANLWLVLGGLAAFTEQWWWLEAYKHVGEASLFVSMLLVGVVSTAFSRAGFVAVVGHRRGVIVASLGLLAATFAALLVSVHYRGNANLAGVLPVIALSWLNRLLRRTLPIEA
jgi:hypothetical protein